MKSFVDLAQELVVDVDLGESVDIGVCVYIGRGDGEKDLLACVWKGS